MEKAVTILLFAAAFGVVVHLFVQIAAALLDAISKAHEQIDKEK